MRSFLARLLRALRAVVSSAADERLVERLDKLSRDVRVVAERTKALPGVRDELDAVRRQMQAVDARMKRHEVAAKALRDEQRALRLVVERGGGGSNGATLSSDTVPVVLEDETSMPPLADLPATMTARHVCPVCGDAERTLVCEYNKLVALEVEVAEALRRFDYSLCHGCGIVYAARRPAGETFAALFERFDDTLGRERAGRRNVLLTPGPVSEAERAALRARLAAGTLVSEHLPAKRASLGQAQRDRLAASVHVEILGSLVSLRGARVLEIRSRFGSLLAALRRTYGVEPFALPMTEAQQFVIEQAYGIPAAGLIDFEQFTIPYDGTFHLVAANHMLTHALRPGALLAEVRTRLEPGGYLYLYHEPDEREFLAGGASMIHTLNPFHVQTFDGPALQRALAAAGFETVFVGHEADNLMVLARRAESPSAVRMPDEERTARLARYRKARDLAILRLPERERWRFRDEWDAVIERAVSAGLAAFDKDARLHPVRQTRDAGDGEYEHA